MRTLHRSFTLLPSDEFIQVIAGIALTSILTQKRNSLKAEQDRQRIRLSRQMAIFDKRLKGY